MLVRVGRSGQNEELGFATRLLFGHGDTEWANIGSSK